MFFSVTLICEFKKLKCPREAGLRNPVHINSRFFGSINHMKTVTKLVVFGLYYRKNKFYNSKVLFYITNTICLSFFCIERNYILLCKQQRLPPTFKRTFSFSDIHKCILKMGHCYNLSTNFFSENVIFFIIIVYDIDIHRRKSRF